MLQMHLEEIHAVLGCPLEYVVLPPTFLSQMIPPQRFEFISITQNSGGWETLYHICFIQRREKACEFIYGYE